MSISHQNTNKLIILDRDGVINEDSDDFIKTPDEWQPISGSIEAISRLYKAGYSIYVLSNQSGIARKLFSMDTLKQIHEKMLKTVKQAGGDIAGIYFCPHGPDDNCDCRKPLAGLYEQLAADLQTPIRSFTGITSIGDSIRDLQAAKTAGATPVLVLTGKGLKSKESLMKNASAPELQDLAVYASLSDYTEQLLNHT